MPRSVLRLGPACAGVAMAAIGAFTAIAAPAPRDEPGLSIHLVPASSEPCDIDQRALRCADLVHRGDPGVRQYAYFVLSGFRGIVTVQFSIGYDPAVRVGQWHPCVGGMEFSSPDWPASGAGMGITSSRCLPAQGPDSLLVLGAVEIEPGSWGRIWIDRYTHEVGSQIETCDDPPQQIDIQVRRMGLVRVDGAHPGRVVCR